MGIGAKDRRRRAIGDCALLLRRLKKHVATDLPEANIEQRRDCQLGRTNATVPGGMRRSREPSDETVAEKG